MELLQLRYFCVAAENENFSQTAKKFGVPPSDISQSIKRLEKELGASLFDRCANSIGLNEVGKAFYRRTHTALAELDAAVREISDTDASGQLKICIKSNRRIAMQTVERYRKKYSDAHIIVQHSGDLEAEAFDLIITAGDMIDKGFISQKILSEEMVLAVKKDSELASKEHICTDDIKSQPFITMTADYNLYYVTEQLCASMGFTPRIAIQSDDPFYIRRCVELGLGVAVVPSLSWKGQFSDGIALKRLTGTQRLTYVCYKKEKYLSLAAKEFIRMLAEECAEEEKRK